VAQVVKHLPSKCKNLSSNPITIKKTKTKTKTKTPQQTNIHHETVSKLDTVIKVTVHTQVEFVPKLQNWVNIKINPPFEQTEKECQAITTKAEKSLFSLFLFICLFLWCWSLNSGLHACWAGTLPLQSHCQPFLLWLFWR
jgi:hypothetical protein